MSLVVRRVVFGIGLAGAIGSCDAGRSVGVHVVVDLVDLVVITGLIEGEIFAWHWRLQLSVINVGIFQTILACQPSRAKATVITANSVRRLKRNQRRLGLFDGCRFKFKVIDFFRLSCLFSHRPNSRTQASRMESFHLSVTKIDPLRKRILYASTVFLRSFT